MLCVDFMFCSAPFISSAESVTTTGYRNAISFIERNQVPAVGLTKDRQVLRKLASVYNNDQVCSLVCFVCGQIHTKTPSANSHIDWQGDGGLRVWARQRWKRTVGMSNGAGFTAARSLWMYMGQVNTKTRLWRSGAWS